MGLHYVHQPSDRCSAIVTSSAAARRQAATGVSRPFTRAGGSSCAGGGSSQGTIGRLRQDGLPRLGPLLETLGQVDGVADKRVLQVLLGAEQRRRHRAGGYADTELEGGECLASPAGVHLGLRRVHGGGRVHRLGGVVFQGHRGAEDGHDGIAHELHDGPPDGQDGLVHLGPVNVQLPASTLGSACSAIVE